MTEMQTTEADRQRAEEAAKKATPGEWEIYDSNSWWRIGLKGEYRTVLEPYVCNDGHPDMFGRNRDNDLAHVAAANPAFILRLLSDVATLEARLAEADAIIYSLYKQTWETGGTLLEKVDEACKRHSERHTSRQQPSAEGERK